MKKHILMALGIACLPALALAAPDFNGTWVRDKAKSETVPYPLYWLTRGVDPGGGGGPGNAEFIVTIKQDARTMQVTDSLHPLRTYELDGKAHTVPTDTGMTKANVTTTLKADSLVVNTTQPWGSMPGNVTMKLEEIWSLSADGKVLTIKATRESPAEKKTYQQVFNRK